MKRARFIPMKFRVLALAAAGVADAAIASALGIQPARVRICKSLLRRDGLLPVGRLVSGRE